jgi:hypothetical protein
MKGEKPETPSEEDSPKDENDAPLSDESEDKASASTKDTPSKETEPEQASKDEEDVSPKPAPSKEDVPEKTVDEEENASPKVDTDSTPKPTEDGETKDEPQSQRGMSNIIFSKLWEIFGKID